MAKSWIVALALGVSACSLGAAVIYNRAVHADVPAARPESLAVPQDYREWVYLSSGLDMTYTATPAIAQPPDHDGQFDNVFVNPESYHAFQQTGAWPEKTIFVLENRAARQNASINRGGRTQGAEVTGVELHTKSGGRWNFYALDKDGREHLISRKADCYRCHEAHAAVETTFVQFYPTLLPIAKAKGVLSAHYLAESSAPK